MFQKRLFNKLLKFIMTPEKYARYIGINIGHNCYLPDKNIWSSEPYLITIGNNCQITDGVKIFTHGGAHVARKFYPNFDIFGKVIIGNNVYIGNNALILPGVIIKDNVIVAAGSVVTKSIPDNVVVAGNPAKIICTIHEYIERNNVYNLSSKGLNSHKKRQLIENTPENKFIKKKFMQI